MDGQDIKGISEKLGESLSIPVVIPSVPGKMDETSTNIIQGNGFSAYAAIGAAMRSKGDECISLLPTRGAEITNIKSKVFAVVLVALSTTLLSIGGELLINAKVKSIRNSTTKIRQERSRSDDNILTPVSGIETNIAQMKSQVELINYTMSTIDRVRWFEVLPEVSIIIPRNIWLTSLGWQEGNNDESNKVILSGSAMTYESVFRFIDTIGESSYFRSPNLIFIRKYKLDDLQILQFEIQAQAVVEKMERRNEIANS